MNRITLYTALFFLSALMWCRPTCAGEEKKEEAKTFEAILKELSAKDLPYRKVNMLARDMLALGETVTPKALEKLNEGTLEEPAKRVLTRMLGSFPSEKGLAMLQKLASGEGVISMESLFALRNYNKEPFAEKQQGFLLAFQPKDATNDEALINVLLDVPGPDADKRLMDYILSPNKSLSSRSRQMLIKRIAAGKEISEEHINDLSFKVQDPEEPEQLKPHMVANFLMVVDKLPTQLRAEVYNTLLASRLVHIRSSILNALARDPKLMDEKDFLPILENHLLSENAPIEDHMRSLHIAKRWKKRGAVMLAAISLSHKSRNIRQAACSALVHITGKNIAKNPADWKNWLQENGY